MSWVSHGELAQRTVFQPHTGDLHVETLQQGYYGLMEAIRTIRNEDAVKDLSFGRWALCIPTHDYMVLTKLNPELASKDKETNLRAWKKFIASPESMPYRVSRC